MRTDMILTIEKLHLFITSLVFSFVLETVVLMLVLTFVFKRTDIGYRRTLFAGAFATFATIPYVWFVFPNLGIWPATTALYASELFVTVVEATFYRFALRTTWKEALAASIAANAASFFLGNGLRALGLWFYW